MARPAIRYSNVIEAGTSTNATVSGLINGATYYFAATAYDTSNLESDYSIEVSYTNVVLAPPTIALTSPANNAVFTAPATINLAASVTANGHSITRVQFYNGTTLLGEDTTSPYAINWNNVSAGNYSLTTRLVYDAGATLNSTPAVGVLVGVPRNSPPTISAIVDQDPPRNSPTPAIPFTVSDAETDATNLTLYATSSNPALLPTNNIIFGGSGSNRTVTLTPPARRGWGDGCHDYRQRWHLDRQNRLYPGGRRVQPATQHRPDHFHHRSPNDKLKHRDHTDCIYGGRRRNRRVELDGQRQFGQSRSGSD